MKIKRLLHLIFAIIAIFYTAACAYLYLFQRDILYKPDKHLELPEKYNLNEASVIKLKTDDNIAITAWYIAPKATQPTIIYLHGNTANLGKRAKKFKEFAETGFGILALSYRGFGDSEGMPTEVGLYKDARAAIQYLTEKGLNKKDIILYGESLGTGVATQMATEDKFRALILEAPYDTIIARAAELYPIFPVRLLVKDQYLSVDKIARINTPLLIFHSKDDEVMPIHHGAKLFSAAKEPKKFIVFEHSGHTKFNHSELARLTMEYINSEK